MLAQPPQGVTWANVSSLCLRFAGYKMEESKGRNVDMLSEVSGTKQCLLISLVHNNVY